MFACKAHISPMLLFVGQEVGHMLELSIFRVDRVSTKKLNCVGDSLVESKQRHFWKMAAKQECTQWNGRSDATAREPRTSPCTSLKVYKLYNYVPILLCMETDH